MVAGSLQSVEMQISDTASRYQSSLAVAAS